MTHRNEVGWNFENSYVRLPKKFYSTIDPSPVESPELVILNGSLAKSLGLNSDALQSNVGLEVLAGNKLPEGSEPLAQAYAGHQFGGFTMLGDGRAMLIGEHITPDGNRVDIQLKGSGRTPYSRGGDGRAALGPMIREYIISEAMHALGIRTTRSLAVVKTGEPIQRETELPGAILTRVASSHLRVGTFEFIANWGTEEELKELANYAIERHYPHIKSEENPYLSLLQELSERQASLVAKWHHVGFIHGVMNTDNMTISGETIDYGPCAFMDTYDPATVFSSIDVRGRYAYGNQPPIAAWNLARFAETLIPLLHEDQEKAVELAQEEISRFGDLYRSYWIDGMRAKLGMFGEMPEDLSIVEGLLDLMNDNEADYSNTFLALTFDKDNTELCKNKEFTEWRERWQKRLERQKQTKEEASQLMRNHNPAVIPRNHRVEEALEAAENGDYSVMGKLLSALSDPYAHTQEQEEYAELPPESDRPYRTYCGT